MTRTWSADSLSPLALAFLGDAIWEIHARERCLDLGVRKPGELHKACTKYVSAHAQAGILETLIDELSEDEADVVRRGRNAKSGHIRKNVDVLVYRHSTAFETLIGFLHSDGQQARLQEIIQRAMEIAEENGGTQR